MTREKTDEWIGAVYKAADRDMLKATYDTWAASYDADMLLTGYLHYAVLTGLVSRHVSAGPSFPPSEIFKTTGCFVTCAVSACRLAASAASKGQLV